MLNEALIINDLKKAFPHYIGDDAAVINPKLANSSINESYQPYVLSKDLLVEDTHFRTSYVSPQQLAHKALHVNLSDIAAMGAKPVFILLGLAIPLCQEHYSRTFYQAFIDVCQQANVILIGGDTTKSPDKLFISITVIGTAPTNNLKYRHCAKVGDRIVVCGNLGHAHLGLIASERQLAGFDAYKEALSTPWAKIQEGLWFGQQTSVTAMMDLSDGLIVDLTRLCEASKVGGVLELTTFPPDLLFSKACQQLELIPEEVLLTGGEDYGLLLTVDFFSYEPLAAAFYQQFGYSLTQVGCMEEGGGLVIQGHSKQLTLKTFSHFGESQ